ncbi:glucosaminidase domain-containing protein [Candidatus Daviesbacteria bacterium]|nr:glucosaminidase domain-containing protein [Candidatus Daviesbacteria bacterium]
MNKILTALLVLTILTATQLTLAKPVVAVQINSDVETKKEDQRVKILADYLAKYNSPLQYHAQDFIDAADEYGIDWRLVPAIAGVESTFGRFIPGGYNAWGWGVYGTQAIYFTSWKDGIFTVSKGLKENYISKGLTDPYAMNRIYAASPAWGWKVDYFLKDIDSFSREYNNLPIPANGLLAKIAGNSAQIALK